jgi:hypothetical protein
MNHAQRTILGLVLTFGGLICVSPGQTYIRAILPNPSSEPAVGYNFQILTPGAVYSATLINNLTTQTADSGKPGLTYASFKSSRTAAAETAPLTGTYVTHSAVKFAFDQPLRTGGKIDLRVAFSPKDYWRVYFNDTFQYKDGSTIRSRIPYAAFFINFTPTSDPTKVMASLTVINNIASTYGIPTSVVDDDSRPTINFRHAQVYINNSMSNYSLKSFDHPNGQKVDLPDSFSLNKGQVQVFDLGVVPRNSYVYTQSEVSYEGSEETFPIACAHSPEASEDATSDTSVESSINGAVSTPAQGNAGSSSESKPPKSSTGSEVHKETVPDDKSSSTGDDSSGQMTSKPHPN